MPPPPELKAAVAYHEAGHAAMTMLAFRAIESPITRPVKYVKILSDEGGKLSGVCYGPTLYSPQWPQDRINVQWRDAMEWQLTIDAAGGVAEAIHRGERNKRNIMWFAAFNCGIESDLASMKAITSDLRLLTGRRPGPTRFFERACELLRMHWHAVEQIAAELIEDEQVGSERINQIFATVTP